MSHSNTATLEKLLQRLSRGGQGQTSGGSKSTEDIVDRRCRRPPDAANDKLGREIARCALSSSDLDLVFRALVKAATSSSARGLSPSVSYAVLEEIADRMNKGDMVLHNFEFLTDWLLETESLYVEQQQNQQQSSNTTNESLRHLLTACIRAYAVYLVTQSADQWQSVQQQQQQQQQHQQQEHQQQHVLDLYRRLQLESSRSMLIQHVLSVSTTSITSYATDIHPIVQLWSPLLAISVLSPLAPQRLATIHLFWRSCLVVMECDTDHDDSNSYSYPLVLMEWMTTGLHVQLESLVYVAPSSLSVLEVESEWTLAREWWIVLYQYQPSVEFQLEMDVLLSPLLFRLVAGCPLDLVGFSGPTQLLNALPSSTNSEGGCVPFLMRTVTSTLHWVTVTLCTANGRDRRFWMQVLVDNLALYTANDTRTDSVDGSTPTNPQPHVTGATSCCASLHSTSLVLLHTLAIVCAETEDCADIAATLLEQVSYLHTTNSLAGIETAHPAPKDKHERLECLIQLLELPRSNQTNHDLLTAVASQKFDSAETMAWIEMQQMAALLVGVVLWEHDEALGTKYLTSLLQQYSHLAVTVLPIVLHRLHTASQAGDGPKILRCLEFLAQVLVRDATCAVEIWNVLTQLLSPNLPIAVRVTALRLLPMLVQSNHRMYRRVMDVLGATIVSRQDELRLAVAATLADLAQNDCITDVSDVIGWIQSLLTEDSSQSPMHALLVHFGILSLHHLVVAGDLTFDVVIKVLNKRLLHSGVTNLDAVVALPVVVQESLVLLLGDGECNDGTSSDDSDEEGATSTSGRNNPPSVISISPQVSSSVRALIRLGTALLHEQQEASQSWDATQVRKLRNIYTSLATYSTDALGLTAEGVKSVVSYFDENATENMVLTEAGERYISTRNLVVAGMSSVTEKAALPEAEVEPIVILARKVLEFEEEVIGASLWKKHSRRRQAKSSPSPHKSTSSNRLERGITTSLPDPIKVQQLAAERRTSPGTAIALLLASDGSQLAVIRDNGDATLETSDPLFLVFVLQAYLHVASSVISRTKREEIGTVIGEVESWYEVFVSPDTMYLSLAVLSVYIPFDLPDPSSSQRTYADKIANLVMEAYQNNKFEKDVVAKICLGLIAVSSLRSRSLDLATEIVNTLEQSVRGYGGRQCFGAYYGLGLVSQGLRTYLDSASFRSVVPDAKRLIFRICGFLVEEILTCYEERSDIFVNLVACLKSGAATADLVESMSDLDAGSISLLMTKQVKARYLFISCALCLPALSGLNGALHLAALRLMEAFEWGGGKGIALPPMLRACQSTDLFEAEELKQIYLSFAQTFEDRMGSQHNGIDSEGLDDIFYAFNGTTSNPTSHIIRRTLVGNHDLFDDDGCVLSLIAMTVSIAPVPCLGASFFAIPVDLRSEAGTSDVESVVDIVRDASASETESKYSEMAIILMAYLSSLKHERELCAVGFSLPPEGEKVDTAKQKLGTSRQGFDFEKIPCPHAETLLAGLLEQVERFESNRKASELKLTRVLSALECLSLPDGFATFLIEPLLRVSNGKTAHACVSLLCSQLSGRRRAVFGGRDFMLLALKLSNTSKDDWDHMDGNGKAFGAFVSGFADILRKLPPDSTESALEKTWKNCLTYLPSVTDLVLRLLDCCCKLLRGAAIAPKTVKAVRQFVTRIARDLPEYSLDLLLRPIGDEGATILDSYVQCLLAAPTEILEENEFFHIAKSFDGFETEVVKVMLLIDVIASNYFASSISGREEAELSKALSWIAKKLQHPIEIADRYALRRVMQAFAKATTRESSSCKKDRLRAILDVLQQTKNSVSSRIGIQWLSVVLSYWSPRCFSDARLTLGYLCMGSIQALPAQSLERALELLVQDLPSNLAVFAAQERISAAVSNQLLRLHQTWSEQNVDKEVQDIVRTAFFACNRNAHSEESFTALSSSALASSTLS